MDTREISSKGKIVKVPSISISDLVLVVNGKLIKKAEIFDEFWLDSDKLIDPYFIIEKLKLEKNPPDIFAFEQRIPDVVPKYDFYLEWVNYAIANFDSYSEWLEKKVSRSVRKKIRQSMNRGVETKIVPFSDEFVMGVCSIYNELKVRQGRRFWHYGKSFETIKKETGTYLGKSVFIGAYFNDEMIGFAKIVLIDEMAASLQIISKAAFSEKRPTNALLSKVVKTCEERQIKRFIYGEYSYGHKEQSSLIDFKRSNGFEKIDVPRYYVPLTYKGKLALRFGLHRGLVKLLPNSFRAWAIKMREKFHSIISKT